jgi:hypothetical protein
MSERPLHVRVAEVLGWTMPRVTYPYNVGAVTDGAPFPPMAPAAVWLGIPPPTVGDVRHPQHRKEGCVYAWENEPCECEPPEEHKLPRFDTDWAEAGPLIERFGITVHKTSSDAHGALWVAFEPFGDLIHSEDCFGIDGYADHFEYGNTPLEATCRLILSLASDGRLV